MSGEEGGKPPLRDRVFRAAAELFHAEGIRGVGVDAIARAAQTTKMGLYRQFASKDELITEWVRDQVAQYTAVLDRLAERWPDDPRRQLAGFAEFIADDVASATHRGCRFINTVAELPDAAHPARKLIEEHKARQLARLTKLCRAAGHPHPGQAALHLTLVLEGAQAVAQNGSAPDLRQRLLEIAAAIVG